MFRKNRILLLVFMLVFASVNMVHGGEALLQTTTVVINEVDADTPDIDVMEFVELYDGGAGNTDLSGLVVVFYNGSNDASYSAFDLDGFSTDANGYFLLGNSGVTPTPSIIFGSNGLQNGADAVALYVGDATDFPNGTAVTSTNIVDALVYDTSDDDDAGLLAALTPGQPQVDENGNDQRSYESNQRCPDGGAPLETTSYIQAAPTPGAANCSVQEVLSLKIHDVQGDGAASPYAGRSVKIQGIVVGDFQSSLGGYYVQEEDAETDANPATSEGIFVYDRYSNVSVGDLVSVTGGVQEYYGLTEISADEAQVVDHSQPLPTAATIHLPVSSLDEWEQYEGMLVNFPQTLTATEVYNLGRYGKVLLSADGRLRTPTNVVEPGAQAILREDRNLRNQISLDDYNDQQNRDPILYPQPDGLSADNTLRDGYTVDNLTAVLDYGYGEYRLQPVAPVDFDATSNSRTSEPDHVDGSLKVAGFNVLNFFNGDGQGGGFPTSRGADDTIEFERQRAKIIHAILAIDADVVGLTELENDGYGPDSAIQDLVNGLNEAIGSDTYAFIDPGVANIGTDAIAVGLIYKHTTVEPLGDAAILDSSVDPDFIDTLNRPALAQTFRQIATHSDFTAVINHLKSKGSDCNAVGDPDTGDGQGNCNLTRTKAAIALANWLATDPTNSGDSDILIIGDLNSYAMEDPITALTDREYTNLIERYVGDDAYSYVYFGESGYLDHALANGSLAPQVMGATQWHINADEPSVLDYNTNYKSPGQWVTLYNDSPYRSSDHDPVVVGLDLEPTPIEVVIDIKPDSDDNPINLKSKGVVPVAILSSADFDAALVDPTSIMLAGAPVAERGKGQKMFAYEDVNGDGLVDLLFQVDTQALHLNEGDVSATLEGALLSGIPIVGSDAVRTVPGDGLQLVLPENGANVAVGSSLFTWTAPDEAACYLIQIDTNPNFGSPDQEATVVGGSQYTSNTLAGGLYFWRVQAGGACNIDSGPWSEVWSVRVR